MVCRSVGVQWGFIDELHSFLCLLRLQLWLGPEMAYIPCYTGRGAEENCRFVVKVKGLIDIHPQTNAPFVQAAFKDPSPAAPSRLKMDTSGSRKAIMMKVKFKTPGFKTSFTIQRDFRGFIHSIIYSLCLPVILSLMVGNPRGALMICAVWKYVRWKAFPRRIRTKVTEYTVIKGLLLLKNHLLYLYVV